MERRMPGIVVAAGVVAGAAAVLCLLDLWLSYRWERAYLAAHPGTDLDTLPAAVALGVIVVRVAGAAVLLAFALRTLLGRAAGRGAVWVVAAVLLPCPATNLATLSGSEPASLGLPGWFGPLTLGVNAAWLAGLLAAALLLALPSAGKHVAPRLTKHVRAPEPANTSAPRPEGTSAHRSRPTRATEPADVGG